MSRPRKPDQPTSELQVSEFPRIYLDMLDARAQARGLKFRRDLVLEIFDDWAKKQAAEWMLMERICGSNPAFRELAAQALEERKS